MRDKAEMRADQTRWGLTGDTYSENHISLSSVPRAPTTIDANTAAMGTGAGVYENDLLLLSSLSAAETVDAVRAEMAAT